MNHSEGDWWQKRRWVPMRLWMWLIDKHLGFAGRHVRWIARRGGHWDERY